MLLGEWNWLNHTESEQSRNDNPVHYILIQCVAAEILLSSWYLLFELRMITLRCQLFVVKVKSSCFFSLMEPNLFLGDSLFNRESFVFNELRIRRTNNDESFSNLLPTEREGHTGEYWPEVVTVRTERWKVRKKTTEGQYLQVGLEEAR